MQILRNDSAFFASLRKFDMSAHGLDRDDSFLDLLFGMLDWNPLKRMSPEEILSHPFIE
jgi:serine/threonine protein kinase